MAEKEIKGAAYTLVEFNGKLLASINSTVSNTANTSTPLSLVQKLLKNKSHLVIIFCRFYRSNVQTKCISTMSLCVKYIKNSHSKMVHLTGTMVMSFM